MPRRAHAATASLRNFGQIALNGADSGEVGHAPKLVCVVRRLGAPRDDAALAFCTSKGGEPE